MCTLGGIHVPISRRKDLKVPMGSYPSVVFEMVSDHRKKLLSISYLLHPGTRNDNHIVKTFLAAKHNLHDRNSFLGR